MFDFRVLDDFAKEVIGVVYRLADRGILFIALDLYLEMAVKEGHRTLDHAEIAAKLEGEHEDHQSGGQGDGQCAQNGPAGLAPKIAPCQGKDHGADQGLGLRRLDRVKR